LRATLSMTAITLHLRQDIADAEASGPPDVPAAASLGAAPTTVTIPWTVPAAAPVKGSSVMTTARTIGMIFVLHFGFPGHATAGGRRQFSAIRPWARGRREAVNPQFRTCD
jgi:hypothetical protein